MIRCQFLFEGKVKRQFLTFVEGLLMLEVEKTQCNNILLHSTIFIIVRQLKYESYWLLINQSDCSYFLRS